MRNAALAIGGCLVLFAGTVFGDEVTKRTVITLNEPMIVSGFPQVTLEPGKYVIKLMRHDHDRNIVLFYNEREDHLYTMVLAINNYRLVPKEKTLFQFYETPSGNPIALRAWFFPGDNWGQEFVYPKGLAAKIAVAARAPVLATPAETAEELPTAPIVEEKPVEVAAAPEPVLTAPEVEEAAPPAEIAEAAPPVREPVPATASPFYTVGLLGLVTVAAGYLLRKAGARAL